MGSRFQVGSLILVMLGCMMFQTELSAQGTPDQALYDAAKKAIAEKNLPVAAEKIYALRNTYPQSKFIPDSYVLSHAILLQKGDNNAAEQTLGLISAKWSNTDYVFQALKATCEKLALDSPAKAKDFLDAKGKCFTDPTLTSRVDTLYLTYLSQTDGSLYLIEITPCYDELKQTRTVQKTEMLVNLSGLTYDNLIKAKRAAEIKPFSQQLQDSMAMLGSPVSLTLIEKKNYLTALYTSSPDEFQKEYDTIVSMLKWTDTTDDLQTISNYFCLIYDIFQKDKRISDIKTLHKKLITAASKIDNSISSLKKEYTSYLNILSQGDINEYLPELTNIATDISGNAKNKNDIVFASSLVATSVPILMKSSQDKTMHTLAMSVTDGFFRLKEYSAFESFLNQYLFTVSHTLYLRAPAEYQAIAELVNNMKSAEEINSLIRVLVSRDQQEKSFYRLWDDTTAENIHISFQNAIEKYKVNADTAASENLAYLNALSVTSDPGKMQKSIMLVADAMANIKTKDEAIKYWHGFDYL